MLKNSIFAALLCVSMVHAFSFYSLEPTPTLDIVSQDDIDSHIKWDFEQIDDSTWIMRGYVDNFLLEEVKGLESKNAPNFEWDVLSQKYDLESGLVTKERMANFDQYPVQENKDVTIERLQTSKTEGSIELRVHFPNGFREGIEFKTGFNSTLINTTTGGIGGLTSETQGDKIFYSNITNALYVFFAGNGRDIFISSSIDNGSTWTTPFSMMAGTFTMSEFNCAIEHKNSTQDYLHCVTTNYGVDNWQYFSFNATSTTPYYVMNANYTPFDASSMGESATDRLFNPQMTIDDDGCKMVMVDFQDASEAASDQHELVLFRENQTNGCGDIVWENNTMDNGFPIYSVQDELGYANAFGSRFVNYLDGNMQLYWGNSDTTTAYVLNTKFYDAANKAVDVNQRSIDTDIEYGAFGSVLLSNNDSLLFYQIDGGSIWRAYYMAGQNGTITNHSVSTVASTDSSIAREGTITASFNAHNNTVYYVYAGVSSQDYLYLRNLTILNSTNFTVSNNITFSNYTATTGNNARDFSSFMDYENCMFHTLSTYGGVGYNITYTSLTLPSNVCPSTTPPGDTCTYGGSGDWEINIADNCHFTSNTDVGSNTIRIYGSGGRVTCTSTTSLGGRRIKFEPSSFNGGYVVQTSCFDVHT